MVPLDSLELELELFSSCLPCMGMTGHGMSAHPRPSPAPPPIVCMHCLLLPSCTGPCPRYRNTCLHLPVLSRPLPARRRHFTFKGVYGCGATRSPVGLQRLDGGGGGGGGGDSGSVTCCVVWREGWAGVFGVVMCVVWQRQLAIRDRAHGGGAVERAVERSWGLWPAEGAAAAEPELQPWR